LQNKVWPERFDITPAILYMGLTCYVLAAFMVARSGALVQSPHTIIT
jgi:hypothetical protein